MILFDCSKAFDMVNHDILLGRFSHLGISGKVLFWVKDFLKDRFMNMMVAYVKSSTEGITSCVPQGSVLCPLLSLIYINFVTSNIFCTTNIFTDDLKLYVSIDAGSTDNMMYRSLPKGYQHTFSNIRIMESCSQSNQMCCFKVYQKY